MTVRFQKFSADSMIDIFNCEEYDTTFRDEKFEFLCFRIMIETVFERGNWNQVGIWSDFDSCWSKRNSSNQCCAFKLWHFRKDNGTSTDDDHSVLSTNQGATFENRSSNHESCVVLIRYPSNDGHPSFRLKRDCMSSSSKEYCYIRTLF